MYRVKNGIVQISVHKTLITRDSTKAQYFTPEYESFLLEHEDCELNIETYSGEGGEVSSLNISGWRDCTQQEVQHKEVAEAFRTENKKKSDHNTFLMFKQKYPEWFNEQVLTGTTDPQGELEIGQFK